MTRVSDMYTFRVASIIGCIIREPSIKLRPNSEAPELSLWLTQSVKKDQPVSMQGYWGRLATRKPKNNRRTVQTGFDVTVPDDRDGTVVKPLLVVGDDRCALTYINDPSHGVVRKKGIQANCKLVNSGDWELVMEGRVVVL